MGALAAPRDEGAELVGDLSSRSPHGSLVEALERAAAADAPFLVLHLAQQGPVTLDARDALAGAHRFAVELVRRGARKGDRVVLLLPTSVALVHAFLGCLLAGAIPVPLASPMTFGSPTRFLLGLSRILDSAEARHLVATRRMSEAVASDATLRSRLRERICADEPLPAVTDFHPRLPSIDGSDTAFLQYTSGTTGAPRGASIPHRAVVANAHAIAAALRLGPDDVGTSWLPLFHDMGLIGVMLTALCHPYTVHVMPPERFLMSPDRWTGVLGQVGATITASPNFGYEMATARTRGDVFGLDSLRASLSGAEPVRLETIDRFHRRFASAGFRRESFLPVYGLAENTLAVTFSELGRGPRSLRVDRDSLELHGEAVPVPGHGAETVSVGRPVSGVRLRICDDRGRTLPEGFVGEIRVHGSSRMDGYFHDEEATENVFVDGWLRTGDLGFVHGGELHVTGRSKEVIIKGGRNFHPYDLEAVAAEIEGVVRGGVAAFGRTNAEAGTEDVVVVAEVRVRDGALRDALAKTIRGELLSALGVKADRIVLCPPGALPRTTSGKLQRGRCAAWLERRGEG